MQGNQWMRQWSGVGRWRLAWLYGTRYLRSSTICVVQRGTLQVVPTISCRTPFVMNSVGCFFWYGSLIFRDDVLLLEGERETVETFGNGRNNTTPYLQIWSNSLQWPCFGGFWFEQPSDSGHQIVRLLLAEKPSSNRTVALLPKRQRRREDSFLALWIHEAVVVSCSKGDTAPSIMSFLWSKIRDMHSETRTETGTRLQLAQDKRSSNRKGKCSCYYRDRFEWITS